MAWFVGDANGEGVAGESDVVGEGCVGGGGGGNGVGALAMVW